MEKGKGTIPGGSRVGTTARDPRGEQELLRLPENAWMRVFQKPASEMEDAP